MTVRLLDFDVDAIESAEVADGDAALEDDVVAVVVLVEEGT